MQQFREIDARLQEIVPKIAEINSICREVYRDDVLYEPFIQTEVRQDGTKVSQVAIKVYPDRNNLDESSLLAWDVFQDVVYFKVKDLYEDYEEKNFDIDERDIDRDEDGQIFGWSMSDSWHHIGNVYYFLLSVYNLIETTKDETPIIDTKGIIQGYMTYSVAIDILETDRHTVLPSLDYENLQEAVGKVLRLTMSITKAKGIPDKYSFQCKSTYKFLNEEVPFETKIIERKKDPVFDYKGVHEVPITEELIHQLQFFALNIEVFGMIESKRKDIAQKQQKVVAENAAQVEEMSKMRASSVI